MKKITYSLFLLFITFSLTSCLKSGMEDLPEYSEAEILSVSTVRYRYISNDVAPSSGQKIVKEVDLTYTTSISSENATVQISVSKPSNFPVEELSNLSKANLVVAVGLSTAARLTPVGNAPRLGVPGDWSRKNQYTVTAADGTIKNWSIEIVSLTK